MKTNKLQIIAIVMLMATMTSCELANSCNYTNDSLTKRNAPISFMFNDILYSNNIESREIIPPKVENDIFYKNESGYELTIKRDGFSSDETDIKAGLHLIMHCEEDVHQVGMPYPLHTSTNVTFYSADAYEDTAKAYYAHEGWITFTKIQGQKPCCFFGNFEFTVIDENGEQKHIFGDFSNLGFWNVWLDIIVP